MKLKNKYKLITLLSFGAIMLLNTNNSSAVTMTFYSITVSNQKYISNYSKPTYEISGSEYFPEGKILYKQENNNVIYYSPKSQAGTKLKVNSITNVEK